MGKQKHRCTSINLHQSNKYCYNKNKLHCLSPQMQFPLPQDMYVHNQNLPFKKNNQMKVPYNTPKVKMIIIHYIHRLGTITYPVF